MESAQIIKIRLWNDETKMVTNGFNISEEDKRALLSDLSESNFIKLAPTIAVLAALSVLGTIGNSLSIYVFVVRMKRNFQNDLFLLTSVTNLVACGLCLPGDIVDLRFMYTYPSAALCKVNRFFNMFTIAASVYTLSTLAVYRLRAATARKNISPTRTASLLVVLVLVVVSCATSWLAAVVFGIRLSPTPIPDVVGQDCSISEEVINTAWPHVFNAILAVGFTIFVAITTYSYYKIWRTVKKSRTAVASHASVRTVYCSGRFEHNSKVEASIVRESVIQAANKNLSIPDRISHPEETDSLETKSRGSEENTGSLSSHNEPNYGPDLDPGLQGSGQGHHIMWRPRLTLSEIYTIDVSDGVLPRPDMGDLEGTGQNLSPTSQDGFINSEAENARENIDLEIYRHICKGISQHGDIYTDILDEFADGRQDTIPNSKLDATQDDLTVDVTVEPSEDSHSSRDTTHVTQNNKKYTEQNPHNFLSPDDLEINPSQLQSEPSKGQALECSPTRPRQHRSDPEPEEQLQNSSSDSIQHQTVKTFQHQTPPCLPVSAETMTGPSQIVSEKDDDQVLTQPGPIHSNPVSTSDTVDDQRHSVEATSGVDIMETDKVVNVMATDTSLGTEDSTLNGFLLGFPSKLSTIETSLEQSMKFVKDDADGDNNDGRVEHRSAIATKGSVSRGINSAGSQGIADASLRSRGPRPKRQRSSIEITLTRTAFLLAFTFTLSYLPFFLVSIPRAFIHDLDYNNGTTMINLINMGLRLYFITPTISPAIFWASNVEFRKECRTMWISVAETFSSRSPVV